MALQQLAEAMAARDTGATRSARRKPLSRSWIRVMPPPTPADPTSMMVTGIPLFLLFAIANATYLKYGPVHIKGKSQALSQAFVPFPTAPRRRSSSGLRASMTPWQ